jgi:hypothetical protein
MNVDWFIETIKCEDGQVIRVSGGMVEADCGAGGRVKSPVAPLLTRAGQEVLLCSPDKGPKGARLAADIGSLVHVTAEVRNANDARRFLEVVASYELGTGKR